MIKEGIRDHMGIYVFGNWVEISFIFKTEQKNRFGTEDALILEMLSLRCQQQIKMQIFTYNPYVAHVFTFNQFWDEDSDLGDINNMQMALETVEEGERAQ